MKGICIFFISLLFIQCEQEIKTWNEIKIDNNDQFYSLAVFKKDKSDTLFYLNIDLMTDSVKIFQSKKYPIGLSLKKRQDKIFDIYEITWSAFNKINGGYFNGQLKEDSLFYPNFGNSYNASSNKLLIIKRDYKNERIKFVKLPTINESGINLVFLDGNWFDIPQSDYNVQCIAKDYNTTSIFQRP